MDTINNLTIYAGVLCIGIGFVLSIIIKKEKIKRIIKNGTKTTGIIFKNELEHLGQDAEFYSPIVRFISSNGEWITQKCGDISTYLALYKEGDSVEIIYENDNPKNFIIMDTGKQKIINNVLLVVGSFFILVGIYGVVAFLKGNI